MNTDNKEAFVTTMRYLDHPAYVERAEILTNTHGTLWGDVELMFRLLKAAKRTRVMLLQSASGRLHPDLLTAIAIGFWRRSARPMLIMMGCMWQKDPGLLGMVQKIMLRLADRAIFRYAPQSSDEIPLFSAAWGVRQQKLRFLPYFSTFTEKDLMFTPPIRNGSFIFSGGNSHRDYDSLLKAIESLPEHQFVIASNLLEGKRLPPNVRAGQVPRKEFIGLMRGADAVVVPIRKGLIRATGQQTYLNAMLLEKPTIVTDTLGVRDHVRDGETAIVVDGSPESYVKAIRYVFDPANQEKIGLIRRQARESGLREYTFENHCNRLLEIIDEAAAEYFSSPQKE